MATAKKAAKKAVPKVEEVKQIVLTEEQYAELRNIKLNLVINNVNLADAFSDEEQNIRQVAFEVGKIQARLDVEETRLSNLIDAIDPDPYDPWRDYDENVNEDDN